MDFIKREIKKYLLRLYEKYVSYKDIILIKFAIIAKFLGLNDTSIIYNKRFYDFCIREATPFAEAIVNMLIKYFSPKNVVDIGCGCGIYLREFYRKGIDIFGIDGSIQALSQSLVKKELIENRDLRKPLRLSKRYDLCICFEVVEHIGKKYSNLLIDTLISASDNIVFTAALPGQGGYGHVNEQPEDFWIKLFQQQGFSYQEELTKKIKAEMFDRNVTWYVAKNSPVFKNSKKTYKTDDGFILTS